MKLSQWPQRLNRALSLGGLGLSLSLCVLFASVAISQAQLAYSYTRTSATTSPSWVLQWSDEFNGTAGQAVDSSKWTSDTGAWPYNSELEYYTNATNPQAPNYTTRNAHLDGKGNLVIQALAQSYGGRNYTSARLTTVHSFSQAYGRFEARIKIPAGQGLWPAFWMLGNNLNTVGWPQCGEIDIAEMLGNAPNVMYGSAHGPGYTGPVSASYTLPTGQTFDSGFHVIAVQWSQSPAQIQYFVDGKLYETITPANLPKGSPWVFNHPFFVLLNLAVGGNWPGNPNASTAFPAQMLVDYVRVYKPAK